MCTVRFIKLSLTLLLALPLLLVAQDVPLPLESGWMELVKGNRDPGTGVEMREVEEGKPGEAHTLVLAIPKSSMNHPDTIEEVVVIGKRPEKPVPLDITYEWLNDYDNDNYGLVIHLGKNSNWPIRLYLDSSPGYVR
tara:strand:+ start:78378 stop:78788 length:411 start_codon:yes stop_codon:yes gene_type:complete